jgi:excisionase family DNA binding protein
LHPKVSPFRGKRALNLPSPCLQVPDEGEILTLKQVADFLKVTERTIYRLAAAKKIPAFKVGGTWRFSKAEINQWIQQQSEGGKRQDVTHRRA